MEDKKVIYIGIRNDKELYVTDKEDSLNKLYELEVDEKTAKKYVGRVYKREDGGELKLLMSKTGKFLDVERYGIQELTHEMLYYSSIEQIIKRFELNLHNLKVFKSSVNELCYVKLEEVEKPTLIIAELKAKEDEYVEFSLDYRYCNIVHMLHACNDEKQKKELLDLVFELLDSQDVYKVCPICGDEYKEEPAISRKDNKTQICPKCGIMEALESAGVDEATMEEIKGMVNSY